MARSSASPSSTNSIAGCSEASSSCETCAISRLDGMSNVPASVCSSPCTRASRLDLPLPFSPVMPTFSPRNRPNVAPEKSNRGPRRMATSLKFSIGGLVRIGGGQPRFQYSESWNRLRTIPTRGSVGGRQRPRCCQATLARMVTNGRRVAAATLAAASAAALVGCGEMARLPVESGMGPKPVLPEPHKTLIPTVNVATAESWAEGAKPTPAAGLSVNAFATQLEHPRWLYVLPNGDVLVAETNAPPKPEDGKGIKGRFMKSAMKKAGAAAPSPNRITLLRDAHGDGIAETRTVFIKSLNSPFGMALSGNDFYVADSDAVLRFTYKPGDTEITEPGTKIVDLPA